MVGTPLFMYTQMGVFVFLSFLHQSHSKLLESREQRNTHVCCDECANDNPHISFRVQLTSTHIQATIAITTQSPAHDEGWPHIKHTDSP